MKLIKLFTAFIAAVALLVGFTASAQTTANRCGMWWSGPAESGWGMTIAHHSNGLANTSMVLNDAMFTGLFIYGPDGKPYWVTSGGPLNGNGTTFVSDVYTTTGPSYHQGTFDPNLVTRRKVGTMTVSFTDDTHATMSYSIDGVTVVKALEKLNFYLPPYDSWPSDYCDMWWNPSESGWGWNMAQNGDQIFGVYYGYREDGQPTWFTMSGGNWTTDTSFSGMLYYTQGPSYTNPVFNTGSVTYATVGQATLLFKNRDSITLSMTANCTNMTRNIERLKFIANEPTGGQMFKPTKLSAFILAAGIAGCGGGGGGSSGPSPGPSAATVAITQVTPANGATNVSVSEKPTLTFQVSNGSYLSHTADFRCGGNPVAYTPSVSGSTSGSITLNPSSPSSLLGQTCQSTWQVCGAPSGNPCATITQAWTYASVSVPKKLLLPIGAPTQADPSAMKVIDLATGTLSASGITVSSSLACNAGNLTNTNLVRIACGLGSVSHWDYNPLANTMTQNTVLAKLPNTNATPVISSPAGTDFYGVGSNVGGGQVLVRNGNTFTGAIDISTKSTQYVSRIAADFPSGKLFTLNDNSSISTNPLRVDRIDIASSRVEASFSEDRRGVDFALYQGEVYVAMYRNSTGKDVIKYNAFTFTKTGETSVPGISTNIAAFAIAVDSNGVHVGTATGVQTLSHDLKTVLRTTPFPGGAEVGHITASNGKLYIIIINASVDNVLEIDSATHAVLRKWTVAGSPYRPVVVGN